jgi:hypothetical protein
VPPFTPPLYRSDLHIFDVVIIGFDHHQQAAFVVAVREVDRFFTFVMVIPASARSMFLVCSAGMMPLKSIGFRV